MTALEALKDTTIAKWLDEAALRISDAKETGDDAVVRAALDAYLELCSAIMELGGQERD